MEPTTPLEVGSHLCLLWASHLLRLGPELQVKVVDGSSVVWVVQKVLVPGEEELFSIPLAS